MFPLRYALNFLCITQEIQSSKMSMSVKFNIYTVLDLIKILLKMHDVRYTRKLFVLINVVYFEVFPCE
jgi:hypothetical protein